MHFDLCCILLFRKVFYLLVQGRPQGGGVGAVTPPLPFLGWLSYIIIDDLNVLKKLKMP